MQSLRIVHFYTHFPFFPKWGDPGLGSARAPHVAWVPCEEAAAHGPPSRGGSTAGHVPGPDPSAALPDNKAARFAEGRKSRTDFRAPQRNLAVLWEQKPGESKTVQEKNPLSGVDAEERPLSLLGAEPAAPFWGVPENVSSRRGDSQEGPGGHPTPHSAVWGQFPSSTSKGAGEQDRVTGQTATGLDTD